MLARVNEIIVFLSKNGCKSSQISLIVTLDNQKISFHCLSITVPDKRNCSTNGVTELLGALRRFLFGGAITPLSIDICFETLISIIFTDSSGAPYRSGALRSCSSPDNSPLRYCVPPLATLAVVHKNDKDFSWVLALRIQNIQILLRIRIHQDSWANRSPSIPDSLLQCKRHFESEEKSLQIAYESGEIWSNVNVA